MEEFKLRKVKHFFFRKISTTDENENNYFLEVCRSNNVQLAQQLKV